MTLRRGAACALLLAAIAADLGAADARLPRPARDETPPVVLVLPPQAATETEDLILRARVHDATGVGRVTLWTKGEHDTGYRAQAMWHVEGQEFMARVEPSPARGSRVLYYVEALDWLGNGPRLSGGPDGPFLARVRPANVTSTERSRSMAEPTRVTLGLGFVLLLLLALLRGQRRREADREFWIRVLTPLADKRGSRLKKALADLCARPHEHPRRGPVRVARLEALRQMERLRRAGALLEPRPAAPPARRPKSRYGEIRLVERPGGAAAQQAFWLYPPDEEPRSP